MGDGTNVIWAQPLPSGMSMQQEELIALTKALELGASKKINIHTDSRYVLPQPTSTALYAKKQDCSPQKKQEILDLLDALMKPATVSIIHCPVHQRRRNSVVWHNDQAESSGFRSGYAGTYPAYGPAKTHLLENGTGLRDGFA